MHTGKRDHGRRSFIREMVAGTALLAGLFSFRDKAEAGQAEKQAELPREVLYRETEEFRKYYDMLRS